MSSVCTKIQNSEKLERCTIGCLTCVYAPFDVNGEALETWQLLVIKVGMKIVIRVQLPLTADQLPALADSDKQLLLGLPEKPRAQLYTADAPRLCKYVLGTTAFVGPLGKAAGQ